MHLHRSQTLQARDIRDRLRNWLLSLRGSQRLDLRQWSRVLYKGVLGNVRLRFGGKRVLFKYIDLNYEMLVLISKHLPGLNIVAVTEAIPVQIIKAAESFILEPVNTV